MEKYQKEFIRYISILALLCSISLCVIVFPRSNPFRKPQKAPLASPLPEQQETPDANTKLATDLEKAIREIRTGVLPPIEEDAIIDEAADLMEQDTLRLVNHSETRVFFEQIIERLRETPTAKDDAHRQKLRLYDDRFIPPSGWQVIAQGEYPFSLPGSTIYFGAEFFLGNADEAEVAAVFAHEMAHGILRHNAVSRLYSKNIARLQEQAMQNGSLYALRILGYAAQVIMLEYSLRKENDADELGQVMLRQAGYDDAALASVLKRGPNEEPRVERAEKDSKAHHTRGAQREKFIIVDPEKFRVLQTSLKKYLGQSVP